jgi:hypothetical protein
MKRSIIQAVSALAVALTALASSSEALADAQMEMPAVRTTAPGPALPHEVITYEESMPNGALIGSGLAMFGVSYIPSMIVAASSDRPGDSSLYVPVAGPWINLTQRDNACPGGRCTGDAANKVMLVVDGVFQGIGALQVVGGFLFPTTRTVTQTAGVRVLPSVGANHVGLTAAGSF